jgi:hypothetical protein
MVTLDEPEMKVRECASGACWFDGRLHENRMLTTVQSRQTQTLATPFIVRECRPIFAVSDLHLGDGGPRDNFAHMSSGHRLDEFLGFLRYVCESNGKLIIVGDLFDFWQANLSRVIVYHRKLLDTLAEMEAIYVLGNHDSDLRYFLGEKEPWLKHPFFKTMREVHTETVDGQHIHFLHGHQVDSYCSSDTPGIGRATAIYTGLKEDRHGGPMLHKHLTVEKAYLGWMEWLSGLAQRLMGKGGRYEAMNRDLCGLRVRGDYHAVVSGHTHIAGTVGTSVYNTGTWAEQVNSFVLVAPGKPIGVFDWIKGLAVPQLRELKVH